MYDMDFIEDHNIGGGQFYSTDQIGMLKGDATMINIRKFSGEGNHTVYGEFVKNSPVNPICIATFDNMEARKMMFDNWVKLVNKKGKDNKDHRLYLFLNISMLPEGGFVELIDRPSRVKRWRKEWVPSSEMPDLACSFKSTTHNAMLMGARAVGLLNNVVFNHIVGEELRPVPYKTIEDLVVQTMDNYD